MKKTWIGYNVLALFIIVILSIAHLIVNFGDSIENVNTYFMGLGFVVYWVNVLIIMPILFIVLFFKRKSISRKEFFIGFCSFVLFLIIGLFPFISYLGWASF
jgi:hypothetical protein